MPSVAYPRGNGEICKLVCVIRMTSQPVQALLKQSRPLPPLFKNVVLDICPKMLEYFSRSAFPAFIKI